jgi:CDP-glucose 4,6-dehydratase
VTGLALAPETKPNLFEALRLSERATHLIGDVTNAVDVAAAVRRARPEIVFHLAAQPLVRRSYAEPIQTFATNVMGTAHVLETLRSADSVRVCVVVTSDKCYENRELDQGYAETDAMGGHDPYSASKGCAELLTASYRRSFFHTPESARIATVRAGNVIGGGDWSADRIVPDFVSSILQERPLVLRNPRATRPWQHVLEPLSGYLHLAAKLWTSSDATLADAWNFGPDDASVVPVVELAQLLCRKWGRGEVVLQSNKLQPHEAGQLKLDSTKAQRLLGWSPVWNVEQAVEATVEWYRGVSHGADPIELTHRQIDQYTASAPQQNAAWVAPTRAAA